MYPFAAADFVECLLQFGVLGFVVLMSLGGWVIKKLNEGGNRRPQRPHRPAQANPPIPRPGAADAGTARNPYVTSWPGQETEPYVLEADVIETTTERHLHSTVSSSRLAEHAEHLGHIVTETEVGAHDRFDEEVGRLGDSSDAVHEDPNKDKLPALAVTTGEIVDVFRNPERIREAIILNEILARPESRWS